MMKVKRYIIILITIFISMFISCKSVNKKLEKMNSFKFIGVWKINSVEVFDEEEAVKKAADFIWKAVVYTEETGIRPEEGIIFEHYLGELIQLWARGKM